VHRAALVAGDLPVDEDDSVSAAEIPVVESHQCDLRMNGLSGTGILSWPNGADIQVSAATRPNLDCHPAWASIRRAASPSVWRLTDRTSRFRRALAPSPRRNRRDRRETRAPLAAQVGLLK
jgi:hypothetical protein